MLKKEYHYRWQWTFQSPTEALWPWVSDTNRFNRDAGLGTVTRLAEENPASSESSLHTRYRLEKFGMSLEWDEAPFEWLSPHRFSVRRQYVKGPLKTLELDCTLTPLPSGGTAMAYDLRIAPSSGLGALLVPLILGWLGQKTFESVFRRYDERCLATVRAKEKAAEDPQVRQCRILPLEKTALNAGSLEKLRNLAAQCESKGVSPDLTRRLARFIERGDDFALRRIRPYALAEAWDLQENPSPAKDVLAMCLHATRLGLLDSRWDLLCPLCRGVKASYESLRELRANVHCGSCNIDFQVRFDQSVELTFTPNPSIRFVDGSDYCFGGPQTTPHIVAQSMLPPGGEKEITLTLKPGRYRVRTHRHSAGKILIAAHKESSQVVLGMTETGWVKGDSYLSLSPTVTLRNETAQPDLFILEYLPWTQYATTAAEVTALQLFRDLFSEEALRPNEHIALRTLTVVFTDLFGSTGFYREMGDAQAFGKVMSHFDILKDLVREHDGALVKTMGDAAMAVFTQPVQAIRALKKAQNMMSKTPELENLKLKAGIHTGPCLAITQNDQLDYFGTTVNMAARLVDLSSGVDIVLSSAVLDDPQVKEFLKSAHHLSLYESEKHQLRGFGDETFELWHLV